MPSVKRETSPSSHEGLGPGAIAGIAIAAMVVLVVSIALATYFMLRRDRKRKSAAVVHDDRPIEEPELAGSRCSITAIRVSSPDSLRTSRRPENDEWFHASSILESDRCFELSENPPSTDGSDISDKISILVLNARKPARPLPTDDLNASLHGSPPSFIDPWQLEYGPNPGIFPHLITDAPNLSRDDPLGVEVEETNTTSLLQSSTPPNHETAACEVTEELDGVYPITPPQHDVLSPQGKDEYERWEAESGQGRNLSEFSGSLQLPGHENSFYVDDPLDYLEENTWKILEEENNDPAPTQRKLPLFMTPSETPIQTCAPRTRDPSYPCPVCGLKFSTAGIQRDHYNRKHNRRYVCVLCKAAFNLQADLKRHEVNVHRNEFCSKPSKTFTCSNASCTTPGKEYSRKDNFRRHVERRKRAGDRARVQMQGVEVVDPVSLTA